MRRAASTSEPRRRALAAGLALLIAACQPAPALREERLHVFGSIADLTWRDADPAVAQAALAEASALLSRYQREAAFSSAQAAWGRLYNSIGLDVLPNEIDKHDIKTLSREIQRTLNEQEQQRLLITQQGMPNAQNRP